MTENSGTAGSTPSYTPTSSGGKGKLIAIAVAVILIVTAVAVVYEVSKPSATSSVQANGVTYTFATAYGGALKSVSYSYGDGVAGTATSNGTNANGVYLDQSGGNASFSHTYYNGGSYLFSTIGTYSDGSNSQDYVAPVQTITPTLNSTQSAGFLFTNQTYTTAVNQLNTSNIFMNTGNVALELAYYTEPSNASYQIYKQTVTFMHNGTSKVYTFNYVYNATNGGYAPTSAMTMNLTASSYYGNTVAQIVTTTGIFNTTTGTISSGSTQSVTSYYDMVVSGVGTVTLISAYKNIASGTFTNAELETGGFKTLDPQIAYDTVSDEILANTYQQLFIYNGSSVSSYSPYLAKQLPTTANGGVNTAYQNYTATFNPATAGYGSSSFKYNITVAPGTNYTIKINPHATFQNGTPVTAYDVYYSIVRDLIYTSNAQNPGWILAQYMVPGNYYVSNTYYNITQNLTYSNSSNSITIHFQKPMAEALVYQIFYTSGTYITSASWLEQHGAGITFNATGFKNYEATGVQGSYNQYIQFNVDANGPYTIYSVSQNSKVVLKANPNFVSPNKWVLAPSYKYVVIEYIAEPTTTYLLLKSGQAQAAGIPTSSFQEVLNMKANGLVNYTNTSTLSLFWYNFNANVNYSLNNTLATQTYTTSQMPNMPFDMFVSLHARRAFAFAYNHNYYLNNDIGNGLFNPPLNFAQNYAGMIPLGMAGGQPFSYFNSTSWGKAAGIGMNMTLAKQNWNTFIAHWNANPNVTAKGMQITNVSGTWEYKGKPLQIPINPFSADPVDLNGATLWAQDLNQFIPGAVFPIVPTSFTGLLGDQVQGQNPMPIYELGWAPDYPYPTDYLNPMANPLNGTTYPGPNDFTPWWFGHNTSNPYHNMTEANIMHQMLRAYANGTNQINTTQALYWFHQENNMLINMTYYTYIEQENAFLTLSSSVNFTQAEQYQLGTVWVGAYFLYNDFSPA
jgi:ABC-type transport system substrate-binding protein